MKENSAEELQVQHQTSLGNSPSASSLASAELLAPAGDWQCARAAIANGANAIYFGLDVGFNARVRATNFHITELPELMETLHGSSVRGYVTLNTLVFTNELQQLEQHVRQLAAAGVDAVLVQDLGAAKLIRAICPELPLHASTQVTLTNAAAIEQVRELGIQRVVLGRELSISEITKIRSQTDMPLEVFVHGALCVAYSGQCLTSESLGGRSANRGHCAQACRLPYDIVCDGQLRDLGSVKYLLSPQDLAAYDLVPQLLDAGVCSLKIEGRLKSPEYVASTCRHYRQAIDAAAQRKHCPMTDSQRYEMEMCFSRGFSPGWLEGCDHKRLVPGISSAKRGVLLGELTRHSGQRLTIELCLPLGLGNGIVIEGDRLGGKEIGGRVYEMWQDGKRVSHADSGQIQIALEYGLLRGQQLSPGLRIFKTDDPQLTKQLNSTFSSLRTAARLPVDLQVTAIVGQPVEIKARIPFPLAQEPPESPSQSQTSRHGDAIEICLPSDLVPQQAIKHPLSEQQLREQFSRLGDTKFYLREIRAELQGQPMVPLSALGALRKSLVEKLQSLSLIRPYPCRPLGQADQLIEQCRIAKYSRIESDVQESPEQPGCDSQTTTLRILCRSLQQLELALESGAANVIADFHDLRQYRQAVDMACQAKAKIELATLRIHKPGEDGLFHALRKYSQTQATQPNTNKGAQVGWLVRSLAALRYCRQHSIPFAADFSLNATNPLTADQLLTWGAGRVTASYDLNRDQLFELVRDSQPSFLEVVIHQHMPMFHMEHCVFCSVLSPGKNKSDCGRPCDRHDVKLADRLGAQHVLHADIGCRNTLYNANAQSGAEATASLIQLGVRQFRIELLRDYPRQQTLHLIGLYQQLIAGQIQGQEVWRVLKADNRIGVTRGTLEQPRNPLAIL
ncbi:MAG TPA: peptidase U32 [Planctomycetaceae bacterium]|nr:peptidase U32 [Planctomycetaceae bacterium]